MISHSPRLAADAGAGRGVFGLTRIIVRCKLETIEKNGEEVTRLLVEERPLDDF